MKILSLLFFFTIILTKSAFAIAPLNSLTIEQAELYGISQVKTEPFEFTKPWCAYEEKTTILNESSEHAHLYTSFLLIATEARERAIQKQPAMQIEDTEKIISDYVNLLSFSIQLKGNTSDFCKGTRAFLKQEDSIYPVIYSKIPNNAEKILGESENNYFVQGYVYFDESKVNKEKPVVLIILTDDNREHRFFFDLKKIK